MIKLYTKYSYKKVGLKKVRLINITYIILCLIIFALSAFSYVKLANQYETNQLKYYGIKQKIKIKEVRYKGKGNKYAIFDYYLNGEKYSNDLLNQSFVVGDSATIIFSSDDTDILKWFDDYE